MPIHHVAIIPAAPLLLPAASPSQPEEVRAGVAQLRRHVAVALDRLPATGSALLLDAGPESLVHDAAEASLAGYGLPHVRADVTIDAALLSAVSARGQAPRVRSDRLDGDLAVLALLLADTRPELAVAPVTVPTGAGSDALTDLANGLLAAVAAVDTAERLVSVIAAGDLAATLATTSPGYLVDGAPAWDERAVAAVQAGDVDAFGALGPEEAARVQARGWAPITVALRLAEAAGVSLADAAYLAPRGVGQLVAA